jgi:hypothetical protein
MIFAFMAYHILAESSGSLSVCSASTLSTELTVSVLRFSVKSAACECSFVLQLDLSLRGGLWYRAGICLTGGK